MYLQTNLVDAGVMLSASMDAREDRSCEIMLGCRLALNFARDGHWNNNGSPAGPLPSCWLQWTDNAADKFVHLLDQRPVFGDADCKTKDMIGTIVNPRKLTTGVVTFDVALIDLPNGRKLAEALADGRSPAWTVPIGVFTREATPDKTAEHQSAHAFYDIRGSVVVKL